MVGIKGLEKFAPKDFPGFISCTVFTGGCNFRCPYCHNSDLVLNPESLPIFPKEFFLSFLDSRKDWLEAVCISGGEPFIHKDLKELINIVKEKNFLVKIDTNGTFPEKLDELIQGELIDYVALDVKAPWEKYGLAAGVDIDIDSLQRSIDIIKNSNVNYMFRTTIVPDLIELSDVERIGEMLEGGKNFCIQQFFPRNTLDKNFLKKKPYSPEQLREFAKKAEKYFDNVTLEGI